MTTNTVDAIYIRHQRSLMAVDRADDVVLFSLRLALEELAATAATSDAQIAMLTADLERLQTDANSEIAELRNQIAQLDADNAALIRRNKELADELHACRDAATWTVQQLAPAHAAAHNGTFNAVITDHPDGTAITIRPAPAAGLTMWNNPELLDSLDQETADWWIGVSSGRHQWRTVPKPVQLSMVREVMAASATPGAMTMREFDAIKPSWMPSANSHTQTLRLSWAQLNDWSVEL